MPLPLAAGPRRARRSRPLARAAAAVASELAMHGASERDVAISRVVVYSFGADTIAVAGTTLQRRCGAWGIRGRWGQQAPSLGAVVSVLEWMRAHGFIAWARAHVPRWHGILPPSERPRLYPRATARTDYEPRLPARRLHAIGRLLSLLRAGRAQSGSDRTLLPARSAVARTEQESPISPALGAVPAAPASSSAEPIRGAVARALARAGLGALVPDGA